MWLCLNNAFLSIVDKAGKPGHLCVRARRAGDIEKVFPDADVRVTRGNDYLFRADVSRSDVAKALGAMVLGIDYDNFKDSTDDKKLHDAYMRVWHVMADLQPGGPYGQKLRSRGRGLFDDGMVPA